MSWLAHWATGNTPHGPTDTSARPARRAPADGEHPEDIVPGPAQIDQPPEGGEEKVKDIVWDGRMVANKSANRPFLAYREYREKLDAEHEAWLQRKKEREEKIARGEPVGPEERDPTEETEIGCVGLLKIVLVLVLVALLAGKFFTGSYTWNYETNIKKYWPTNQSLFSESTLAKFDGTDPDRPIYLAIDGDVYDVSSNPRTYGPGGSYHHFAGVDAARAYATGCFAEHRTHDLRGLTEKQLASVEHWKDFFATHKTYYKVGRVQHPTVDPDSPIPPDCKKATQSKPQSPEPQSKESAVGPENKRTEL